MVSLRNTAAEYVNFLFKIANYSDYFFQTFRGTFIKSGSTFLLFSLFPTTFVFCRRKTDFVTSGSSGVFTESKRPTGMKTSAGRQVDGFQTWHSKVTRRSRSVKLAYVYRYATTQRNLHEIKHFQRGLYANKLLHGLNVRHFIKQLVWWNFMN